MGNALLSFQVVPPAPGRPEAPGSPAGQPQTSQPASQPQGGPTPESPGGFAMLFPLLLLVPLLLLMFWSTRSQQKKQAAVVAGLNKGDRVLTQSGLVGKLVEIGDRYAKVEVAPGVKVELLKSGLLGKDTPETAAAAEQKK